jgi:tRNA pseudouridine55 synthase
LFDGIINVYKEKGYTSHDVVAKMRGILRMKKIGHTGTLDPDAEGVLPVCVGKATKLVDLITDKDKTYRAICKLGVTTDTQDMTGKVIKTAEVNIKLAELEKVISSYIGEYLQLPPMFSAIKVDGKKLYELARLGKEIERDRRLVIIRNISLINYNPMEQEFTVVVECGKGTYIRTLLHDIGETLGCGAAMKSLLRTTVGAFQVEEALKLSEIEALVREDKLQPHIVTIDEVFSHYPKIVVASEFNKLIYNGNIFTPEHLQMPLQETETDMVRVYDSEEHFIGLYTYLREEKVYKPVKMFL